MRISDWSSDVCSSDLEIMAMSLLVLVGGLDTVASQIGFVAHFLAKNPGHRRELIEDPKLIQTACEEFLRRYGLPNTARILNRDYDYKGIRFKKGDMVQMPKCLYGLDDRINAEPTRSEETTYELQTQMSTSYAGFC